jgi:hypothetical protein
LISTRRFKRKRLIYPIVALIPVHKMTNDSGYIHKLKHEVDVELIVSRVAQVGPDGASNLDEDLDFGMFKSKTIEMLHTLTSS